MTSSTKDEVLARLAASRAATKAQVATMTAEDWQHEAFSEESEWHMIDVLRHVVDSERGMTALIVQVKAGGEGVPPDFDLDRWNRRVVSKLQDKPVEDLLKDMDANRANLLAVIDDLDEDDWQKQGRHASLIIMTIEEVCNVIADHETGHIKTMAAVLAAG